MTTATSRPLSAAERHQMLLQNAADFRAVVDKIPDDRLDTQSYCAGWRVRDVVGHIVYGTAVPARKVLGTIAAGGFRVNTVVGRESRKIADRLSPAELRSELRRGTDVQKFGGMLKLLPKKPLLADNVTHLLDITEPLGMSVDIPAARLIAALDLLVDINGWGSKTRAKGLRLVATDVDWSHGSGPEVRGTARHLILALGGRQDGADKLSGDGAAELSKRMS